MKISDLFYTLPILWFIGIYFLVTALFYAPRYLSWRRNGGSADGKTFLRDVIVENNPPGRLSLFESFVAKAIILCATLLVIIELSVWTAG